MGHFYVHICETCEVQFWLRVTVSVQLPRTWQRSYGSAWRNIRAGAVSEGNNQPDRLEKDHQGFASVGSTPKAKRGLTRYHADAYTPQKPKTKEETKERTRYNETVGFRGVTGENIVNVCKIPSRERRQFDNNNNVEGERTRRGYAIWIERTKAIESKMGMLCRKKDLKGTKNEGLMLGVRPLRRLSSKMQKWCLWLVMRPIWYGKTLVSAAGGLTLKCSSVSEDCPIKATVQQRCENTLNVT